MRGTHASMICLMVTGRRVSLPYVFAELEIRGQDGGNKLTEPFPPGLS